MTNENASRIASTTLRQLGGNRFKAMTGARDLCYGQNSADGTVFLAFGIGRGAKCAGRTVNHVRVTYRHGTDDYSMLFGFLRAGRLTPYKEVDGCYAEDLCSVFEASTGFRTSLSGPDHATSASEVMVVGDLLVEDPHGGVWHPSDEARAEAEASADPAAAIRRICTEQPMRGEWRS